MSASDELRGALGQSVDTNRAQVALTEESRLLLQAMLRDEMSIAVAEGIAAAMTDEAAERFWNKGIEVLQRQAQAKAGRFLLDGTLAAMKRLLWVGVFVVVAYSMGGWTLVKAIWAAITPKG